MGGRDQIVYYIVMGSVCGAASTVVGESYRDNEKRPGSFVVVDLPSLNDYPQEVWQHTSRQHQSMQSRKYFEATMPSDCMAAS